MILPPRELRGKSGQSITLFVPAGGQATAKSTGAFLYVVDAPGVIDIRLEQQPWHEARTGTSMKCGEGAVFEWVEVRNHNAAESITVKLFLGFAEYRDDRETILEQPTECFGVPDAAGWDGVQLAGGASVVLSGIQSGQRIRRKAVQIFNDDPGAPLHCYDGPHPTGRRTATILASSAITMPISGYVRIANPNGAAVACALSEVWWVR